MFPYTVIRSRRKTASIQLTATGDVVVRCPVGMSQAQVQAFLADKTPWIEKHLLALSRQPRLPVLTQEELARLKAEGAAVFRQCADRYAAQMGVTFSRLTVRAQRTRWGSCSAQGSLSFNCLLLLAPRQVLEYVVVHELCHRLELNHSRRFWALVAKFSPDYARHRAWLRENGGSLITRLPQI